MTNTQHLQQERQKRLLSSISFLHTAAPTLKYLFQFYSLPPHQLPAIFTYSETVELQLEEVIWGCVCMVRKTAENKWEREKTKYQNSWFAYLIGNKLIMSEGVI